ncbi:ERVV2 protein, partial [Falcunculus frontatus]|nr:ERVV2 protein [Falcunculus frontatus]
GFHRSVRGFLPRLAVRELEQAIASMSGAIEQIENQTNDALSALQQEVASLSKVVKQNQRTLDLLLAAKGGACTVINTSCYVYIYQTLRRQTDLE